MKNDYVRIYLAENETGWAKPIRGKLVKIASIPYSGPAGFEDIVELDHQPGTRHTLPRIKHVISPSGLTTAILQYERPHQGYRLMCLFSLLEAFAEGMFEPQGGSPGLLAVAYPSGIDPVGLAVASGIPQPLAHKSLVEKLKARWPGGSAPEPDSRRSAANDKAT